jgi:putrescine transport system permease protein
MRRRMRRLPHLTSVFAAVIYVLLYAPIVLVVLNSFNANERLVEWGGFTTKWYSEALADSRVREDFLASLLVAVLTTAIALVLAVTAALWARSASARARGWFDGSTYLRIILPEVVIALGLFLLLTVLEVPLGVGTIVAGHVIIYSAYATIIVQARMMTLSSTMEEAALDLGARPAKVFFRITVPLFLPAILSGWLLAFTLSWDDLVVTQFVSAPGSNTLPMVIFSRVRLGVSPVVNALATIMVLVVALGVVLSAVLMRRQEQRRKREEQMAAAG